MKKNSLKGFTLIELLIVITIIGILAVALLPSVLGAPARARDAARKADLNNIVAALESYNSDKSGYPIEEGKCVNEIPGFSTYFSGGKIPTDPQKKDITGAAVAGGCTSGYLYTAGTGTPVSYIVASFMELPGDSNIVNGNVPKVKVDANAAAGLNGNLTPGAGDAYVIIK